MRLLVIGILCGLLSACVAAPVAVPTSVTVASYVAEGVSFATTGKGVSSNVVSEITDQDCDAMRVFLLKDPCIPEDDAVGTWPEQQPAGTPLPVAAGETRSMPSASVTPVAVTDLPDVPANALEQPAGGSVQSPPADTVVRLQAPPRSAPRFYAVIGSFGDAANARALAVRHDGLGATVAESGGGYRVIVPVRSNSDWEDLRRRLAEAGIADYWTWETCAGGRAADDCAAADSFREKAAHDAAWTAKGAGG